MTMRSMFSSQVDVLLARVTNDLDERMTDPREQPRAQCGPIGFCQQRLHADAGVLFPVRDELLG